MATSVLLLLLYCNDDPVNFDCLSSNCPVIQGLRGLIIEDVSILTTGDALKHILSQSKGRNRESFLLASLVGGLIHSFAPGPPKALGGLCIR